MGDCIRKVCFPCGCLSFHAALQGPHHSATRQEQTPVRDGALAQLHGHDFCCPWLATASGMTALGVTACLCGCMVVLLRALPGG